MAAVSTTANSMSTICRYLAQKYDLDEVRLDSPVEVIGHGVTIRRGELSRNELWHDMPASSSDFDIAIQRMKSKLDEIQIDMRQNSIESLADVMALIQRAKEQNRPTSYMLITQDQLVTIMLDADAQKHLSPNQRATGAYQQLFGHSIEVSP